MQIATRNAHNVIRATKCPEHAPPASQITGATLVRICVKMAANDVMSQRANVNIAQVGYMEKDAS